MFRWFPHQLEINEEARTVGLRNLTYDGVCSHVFGIITGGAFLVAFALEMGASNVVVGLLAALGPASMLLQIPGVWLVERLGRRKALVVLPVLIGRSAWFIIPLIPFILPEGLRIPALLGALMFYFGVSSIAGCAFNSWVRDFIPENIFGSYLGKRMAWATGLGAVATVLAGWALSRMQGVFASPFAPYAILFLFALAVGLLGMHFLAKVPEPPPETVEHRSLTRLILEPLSNAEFRQLLKFTVSWAFTITMAAAFFVVYMLERLQMDMTVIVALSVLSQLINVIFFGVWGSLADRFSNRSVLSLSGPLFLLSIALFPFTTLPETHVLTLPLVCLIHVLTGISTAGVNLCAVNIAMQTAPKGKGAAYIATNSLFCGIAAAAAPILGGLLADFFATREFAADFSYSAPSESGVETLTLSALNLQGLDFVFILAILSGLYSMHRLAFVSETGTVNKDEVARALYGEMRRSMAHVSNVGGLRRMTYLSSDILMKMIQPVKSVTLRSSSAVRPEVQLQHDSTSPASHSQDSHASDESTQSDDKHPS